MGFDPVFHAKEKPKSNQDLHRLSCMYSSQCRIWLWSSAAYIHIESKSDETQCQGFQGHDAPFTIAAPMLALCTHTVHEHTHALLTQFDIRTSPGPRFVSRPEAFCSSPPVCSSSIHTALPCHTTACTAPVCISRPMHVCTVHVQRICVGIQRNQ